MIDLDTKPTNETEEIKRPAKAWRNWYKAETSFRPKEIPDIIRERGEIYPALNLWPSRDVAETAAYTQEGGANCYWRTYLGAFPEGTRP